MEPTTIRVMVFGERGAGKTVYLAGMFHQLSVARPGSIVTLHTGEVDRLRLNRIYAEIVNPRLHRFPPSDLWESTPWRFTCQLTNQHGTFRPMVVEYLDYSGEMLDPLDTKLEMTREDIEVDERLQELYHFRDRADAYLIFIDGHKLLRMLRQAPELDGWLESYLCHQLQAIGHRHDRTGRPPLHLVITKWDLLDGCVIGGEPVTLASVAGLIAEQRAFADHLQSRADHEDSSVRVIPVSVTGHFAKLDEQSGIMIKVPGQPVAPCNLEIPFAALLPDTLRWRLDQMINDVRSPGDDRAAERLRHNAELLARARSLTTSTGAPVAGWIARRVLARRAGRAALSSTAVADVAQTLIHQIDAYFDTRERATRERLQAMEEEQRNRRREVVTEQDAFGLALESFAGHLQHFENKNPGSVLAARGMS